MRIKDVTTGIEAEYRFDDQASILVDTSGNGNDADTSENTTVSPDVDYSSRATFNGVDTFVKVGNQVSGALWQGAYSARSIEILFLPTANGASEILAEEGNSIGGWAIALDGGRIYGEMYQASAGVEVDGGPYTVGEWLHIKLTYGGSTLKIYVSGVEIDSDNTAPASVTGNANENGFGGGSNTAQYISRSITSAHFTGHLAFVRSYTGTLTAGECLQRFQLEALRRSYIKPSVLLDFVTRQGSSYTHTLEDISRISPLSWQLTPGGGFAAPAYYNVTLLFNPDSASVVPDLYYRSEARLTLGINSVADFQLHVGQVTEARRHGNNPGEVTLKIVDKYLHDNPMMPTESLVDSWSAVHPEDFGVGYPLYYGYHHRPFYFTAVDCAVGTLLGPRNVSSANHVNSVWYSERFDQIETGSGSHTFLTGFYWGQQSGDNNTAIGSYYFPLVGESPIKPYKFAFTKLEMRAMSDTIYGTADASYINATSTHSKDGDFLIQLKENGPYLESTTDALIKQVNAVHIYGDASWITPDSSSTFIITARPNTVPVSGGNLGFGAVYSVDIILPANSVVFSLFQQWDVGGGLDWGGFGIDVGFFVQPQLDITGPNGYLVFVTSLNYHIDITPYSHAYKRYSVYANPTNSADIAYSNDPFIIAQDLLTNYAGYPVYSPVWSEHGVNSFDFQCLFHERQPLSDILNDFGTTTGRHIWLGDSGTMRLTRDVGIWTSSVSAVLTSSDTLNFEAFNGGVMEATELYKEFQIDYAFDYQRNGYFDQQRLTPANSNVASAANAAGYTKQHLTETKYVVSSLGAKEVLDTVEVIHGRPLHGADFALPFKFVNLEPGDLVDLNHVFLDNTSGDNVYQITRYDIDIQNAEVRIGASKRRDL